MEEKEVRDKLHKILDLAIDVNGLNPRTKAKTGNLPTVFFGFNGHVAILDLDIHKDGWPGNEVESYKSILDLDPLYELNTIIMALESIKNAPEAATSKGQTK